jgi:hypothetical protein
MRFREEEKEMWLEEWSRSGKSAWAYAKENGLNPQTFVKWTKPVMGEQPSFVEVSARMPAAATMMPEILIEKGDVKIHIPLMASRGELRAVMEGLVFCDIQNTRAAL